MGPNAVMARRSKGRFVVDWKLELVVVPVADVDRAKHFYSEQVGFVVDHDTRVSKDARVVQLTPPGSGCSIAIGVGMSDVPPGSVQGMQLVRLLQRSRRQWLGRSGA